MNFEKELSEQIEKKVSEITEEFGIEYTQAFIEGFQWGAALFEFYRNIAKSDNLKLYKYLTNITKGEVN